MVAIAVARSGIGFHVSEALIRATELLPKPTPDYTGSSLLSPLVARGLSISAPVPLAILHLAITAAVMGWTGWALVRRQRDGISGLLAWTLAAGSGIAVVLMQHIGHYDVWMLLGAALLALGTTNATAIAAGLIFGATNAEQAILALAALAICSAALDHQNRPRLVLAAASTGFAYGVVRTWYRVSSVPYQSRAGLWADNFRLGVEAFAGNWSIQVYAWFSAAWPAVLLALTNASGRRRLLLAFGLVAIPALASITTADGTRVFVVVSAPALLVTIDALVRSVAEPGRGEGLNSFELFVLVAGLMIVTPGLMTLAGEVRRPWSSVAEIFTRP